MLNRNDVIDQDDQSHHRQEERLRKQLDKQCMNIIIILKKLKH
jgi:hypothetical protein